MRENVVKRSLTAIVMVDVVGYSRLMGEDEAGTLRRLRRFRGELIDPLIRRHGGRLVNSAGDSLLIEFASVVDAVEASIGMQQAVAQNNEPLDPSKRLEFRIGVNIGDVIVEGRELFGDGVNVAARLQALAEPGGLCLSRAAIDQIRGKINVEFEDRGAHSVKNIARPIEVFALSPASILLLPRVLAGASASGRRRLLAAASGLVGLVAMAAIALFAARYWTNRPDAAARLEQALAAGEPGVRAKERARLIQDYLALNPHRAFAIAPKAKSHWWTGNWPEAETAGERALERCQLRFGEPCALVAIDDRFVGSDGATEVRDMARVAYAGDFDPDRVPGIRRPLATRGDVVGYAKAASPKAVALHPRGVLTLVTAASSQHEAEARSLKACNDDEASRDADGPCYLYAVGDKVVLPQRRTEPISRP